MRMECVVFLNILTLISSASSDVHVVQLKLALFCVGKVMLQRFFDGTKRNLIPRYFVLGKQARFLRFVARVKRIAGELGSVKEMHLAHARDVHQREEFLHFKLCACFFHRFTCCTLGHGFVKFHKACGQRPFAKAWLNVALAQQHLVVPHRHCAHHVEWVFVMDGLAGIAHRTLACVAIVRHAVGHRAAARFAMLYERAVQHGFKPRAL